MTDNRRDILEQVRPELCQETGGFCSKTRHPGRPSSGLQPQNKEPGGGQKLSPQ